MPAIFRYAIIIVLGLFGCVREEEASWQNIEKDLQQQIFMAREGDTIFLPAGNYIFTQSLDIHDKNKLVITGQGESTVLLFKTPFPKAVDIDIRCSSRITLRKMSLHSAGLCAVWAEDAQNISLVELNLIYAAKSRGPSSAICVEHSKEVLIENCFMSKYNEAAIRGNESMQCVVHNNMIWHNGIGVLLTNTAPANILHNRIFDNGGGVLIREGAERQYALENGKVSVTFNKIFFNNRKINHVNSTYLNELGEGWGLVLDQVRHVEVIRNIISKNKTAAIWFVSASPTAVVSTADSSSCSVAIYHNELSRGTFQVPDLSTSLGKNVFKRFRFSSPNIIITNKPLPSLEKTKDTTEKIRKICILSNKGETFYSFTE